MSSVAEAFHSLDFAEAPHYLRAVALGQLVAHKVAYGEPNEEGTSATAYAFTSNSPDLHTAKTAAQVAVSSLVGLPEESLRYLEVMTASGARQEYDRLVHGINEQELAS